MYFLPIVNWVFCVSQFIVICQTCKLHDWSFHIMDAITWFCPFWDSIKRKRRDVYDKWPSCYTSCPAWVGKSSLGSVHPDHTPNMSRPALLLKPGGQGETCWAWPEWIEQRLRFTSKLLGPGEMFCSWAISFYFYSVLWVWMNLSPASTLTSRQYPIYWTLSVLAGASKHLSWVPVRALLLCTKMWMF